MADLLALAERCERAVFSATDDASAAEVVEILSAICHLMLGHGYDAYSPDYVGSLDAAMTLVPENHVWMLANTGIDDPRADLTRGTAMVGLPDSTESDPVSAPTPALALCAAALRARHAIESANA